MPTSVYGLVFKLVFKDPELQKLGPTTIEIETYTTDTVKIEGSCILYLVHLDTKKLQEVTSFVAENDGSVLLLCTTALALGLIQPRTRLDYLPPRASLITSSVDQPKKTVSRNCSQFKKRFDSVYGKGLHSVSAKECSFQANYKQGVYFVQLS